MDAAKDMRTHNLRFLTSEQALADAATFINYYKQKNPSVSKSKWIVFGGSYSGSLAAWMRMKYPHLVTGAVASSAPMKAVINFKDYLAVVRESIGEKCTASIRSATEQLSNHLNNPSDWDLITKKFQLCDPLDAHKKNDVSNLISTLAGNVEGIVQYNKDNRAFEKAPATNITIDTICGIMNDVSSGEELTRYATVNKIIMDAYGQKCLDFKYNNFIESMRETNWTSGANGVYQSCK
ncbi:Serine carboxypeptidase S28-like protein [Leptotrombidium deliense]|uniref:Serine carboxypeptidase S28-like protein n=1 Tax=Leptotrombidium deliense TaxID=299467 RepID=A0A443S457_9ACAR|nr:Serine carboxypeptidase S28-like protein [Leptotrombidium deliense]